MTPRHIRLTPLTALGAEISSVDLRHPLEPVIRDEIEQALLDHEVLFFRDQDISLEDHRRFALSFGEVYSHPIGLPNRDEKNPDIFELYSDAEQPYVSELWHSDSSFEPDPPTLEIF